MLRFPDVTLSRTQHGGCGGNISTTQINMYMHKQVLRYNWYLKRNCWF